MAIAKEDIKPGYHWIQFRGVGLLEIVEVATLINAAGRDESIIWFHGDENGLSIADVSEQYDFIARIEPPEGV